jgi:phage shock protein A
MLEEVREDIQTVKSLVANAITDLKLIERQINACDAEAETWNDRAVLALKKGKEDLSRRALVRKHEYVERASQYREHLATQQKTIDMLKASLKTLVAKLDTMRDRAAQLDAEEAFRSQRRSTPEPPTTLSFDTSAFDAYDRMVERVRDLETQAETLAELVETDDLSHKFHELETKDEIDKQLAELKAKVKAEQETN